MDRGEPTELWKLSAEAVAPTLWNDDWDSSALVIDDYLFEAARTASSTSEAGTAATTTPADRSPSTPELVFNTPSWDQQQLADIGDEEVSRRELRSPSRATPSTSRTREASCRAGTSRGLTEGGDPERVFRFWVGEDIDASVVIDEERRPLRRRRVREGRPRAQEVGQILKLDPSNPDDRVRVVDRRPGQMRIEIWGTPGLHEDLVIVPTNSGRVLGIDRASGEIRWEKDLPGPTWQSPVVVGDVLVMGDCEGAPACYDVSDTTVDPPELWIGRAVGVHRVDAGGVGRPDLRRLPRRPVLRHRRPLTHPTNNPKSASGIRRHPHMSYAISVVSWAGL
ncbi:MAG: PQQ-binding-like beta-propeller repeat protein [Acidimicrobiia bacterium]|nr:PQQ-binding-like beta-propeller repeat protein [Acidimicrobiia bacterium]